MQGSVFILKGDICYSKDPKTLAAVPQGFLVCENGHVEGVYPELPERFRQVPVRDHGHCLILPGLTDLHIHAPQYSYRGMHMDLELLDWLERYTFPEEARYRDLAYAAEKYLSLIHIYVVQ